MIRELLRLGDPRLYEQSEAVTEADLPLLDGWVEDLHDTLLEYRRVYGAGRAIALPQIGIKKRVLYLLTDREIVFINPTLHFPDGEMFEVLDDCMSFPGLCVRVLRHKRAEISYTDRQGQPRRMALEDELSELLQHEYDHLDGILATMRAVDERAFVMTRNMVIDKREYDKGKESV